MVKDDIKQFMPIMDSLNFCARLREHEVKAFLDNTIVAGHMDKETRKVYYEILETA